METRFLGFNKQQVRLMDVFILAPFLFWASSKTDNKTAKYGLMVAGLLTFVYNGTNYIFEASKPQNNES